MNESIKFISKPHYDILEQAKLLIKKADKINDEADDLIEPIVQEIMKRKNIDEIKEYLKILPGGFYRSELRTYYNKLRIKGGK